MKCGVERIQEFDPQKCDRGVDILSEYTKYQNKTNDETSDLLFITYELRNISTSIPDRLATTE